MQIEQYLREVEVRLDSFRSARRLYAPRLAPDFNVLSLLEPDELRLSYVLKELLSPDGSHSQGSNFIDAFLRCFALDDRLLAGESVKTQREVKTDDGRYIDIVVGFPKGRALAIENKPWAADQRRQIAHYLDYLEKTYPLAHCLIYLSSDGRQPSVTSITESERESAESEGRLRLLSYAELIPWLQDCKGRCYSERITRFLDDFIDYIRRKFVREPDEIEMDEIVDVSTRDPKRVAAALKVASARDDIKRRLIQTLWDQLKREAPDSPTGYHFKVGDDAFDYYGAHQSISLTPHSWSRFAICFGFTRGECNGLYFGVIRDDAPDDAISESRVREQLNKSIRRGEHQDEWIWFVYVWEEGLQNWRTSVEPWKMISEGKMSKWMLDHADSIVKALQAHGFVGSRPSAT